MKRDKYPDHEFKVLLQARERVVAVWSCIGVLCPDLPPAAKQELARKFLAMARGEDRTSPTRQITEAQVVEMVWRNMQCIKPYCPLLVFGRELARELNEFFDGESE